MGVKKISRELYAELEQTKKAIKISNQKQEDNSKQHDEDMLEIQELTENIKRYCQTIADKDSLINTLQLSMSYIQPGQQVTKNEKISDPTTYSSSREELRNFLNCLKLKFIGDAIKFQST